MSQIQKISPAAQEPQAFRRQGQHLAHGRQVQTADALQAGLHDLPESHGRGGGAVDVFMVIHLLQPARRGLGVLDNGEGDIRLEGHQPSVGVGKGQDVLADQKALVSDI